MSEIKLTADSGGGTTSIKAPSSTTSNADVVLKLPVADGSSGQVLKTDGSGQLSFGSDISDLVNDTSPQLGGDLDTNGNDIKLTDADKVRFGTGEDAWIQHNDTDFKVYNLKGTTYLRGVGQTIIDSTDSNGSYNEVMAKFIRDGAVELYYDNAKKLETWAGGIKLNGVENAGSQLMIGASGDLALEHDGSNSYIANNTGDLVLQNDAAVKITAKAGGTQRFRFDTDGLKFGTDTAAANGLSDYEEGSWTPAVSNGLSNTQTFDATGKYVKIGKYVHCRFLLQFSGSGDGNLAKFGGLPFQSVNDTARGGGWCLWTNIPGLQDGDSIVLIVEQYATSVACYKDMNQNASTGSSGFTNKAFYGEFSYEAVS